LAQALEGAHARTRGLAPSEIQWAVGLLAPLLDCHENAMKLRYRTMGLSTAVILVVTAWEAHGLELAQAHGASVSTAAVAGLSTFSKKPTPYQRATEAAVPRVSTVNKKTAVPSVSTVNKKTAVPSVSTVNKKPAVPSVSTVNKKPAVPSVNTVNKKLGLMHVEKVEALVQRSTAHSRKGLRQHGYHKAPPPSGPREVEDMETIWGVPKIVWVILADVLAMAAFLACIPFVMYLAKRRRPEMGTPRGEGEQGGFCACLYPPEPPKMYPDAYSGGGYGGGYNQGYNQGYAGGYSEPPRY